MRYVYQCALRWSDMDATATSTTRASSPSTRRRGSRCSSSARARWALTSFEDGIVISRHEMDYLRPVDYGLGLMGRRGRHRCGSRCGSRRSGASRFTIAYELFDGDAVASRARSVCVPFDLERQRPRRLSDAERAFLSEWTCAAGRRCGRVRARLIRLDAAAWSSSALLRARPAPRSCACGSAGGRLAVRRRSSGTASRRYGVRAVRRRRVTHTAGPAEMWARLPFGYWWCGSSPSRTRTAMSPWRRARCCASRRPSAAPPRRRDEAWRWPIAALARPGRGAVPAAEVARVAAAASRTLRAVVDRKVSVAGRSVSGCIRDALLDHVPIVVTGRDRVNESRCRSDSSRRWSGWVSSGRAAAGEGLETITNGDDFDNSEARRYDGSVSMLRTVQPGIVQIPRSRLS